MKRFIALSAFCLCFTSGFGQLLTYTTSGAELILSFASIDQTGGQGNSNVRFAPVVNLHTMIHLDFSDKMGLYSGVALRNVGYRMADYLNPENSQLYEKSFRSYNVGIPIGIKFGDVKKLFFYAGYEIELGVLYKEKTYEGNDKIDKITGWFSDRQNIWQSGLMAGVQLPYGANIRFKYYLTEFHNKDFTGSGNVKPYGNLTSNVYYFSLTFFILRNATVYYKE
jgi:hypothetical protein